SCRCTQAHNDSRLDRGDFCVEPGATRGNFTGARLLMNAALAARLPFEMLHYVRHVDLFAIDTGFDKGSVQQPPRRPYKGFTAEILVVPGLFSNQHDLRSRAAFPKDSLGGIPPKGTIAAVFGFASQFFGGLCKKIGLWRDRPFGNKL